MIKEGNKSSAKESSKEKTKVPTKGSKLSDTNVKDKKGEKSKASRKRS